MSTKRVQFLNVKGRDTRHPWRTHQFDRVDNKVGDYATRPFGTDSKPCSVKIAVCKKAVAISLKNRKPIKVEFFADQGIEVHEVPVQRLAMGQIWQYRCVRAHACFAGRSENDRRNDAGDAMDARRNS